MTPPSPLHRLSAWISRAWHDRAILLKAATFAVVGLVNTLVDAVVFFLAYAYLTPSLIAANVTSWIVAVTCSFTLNSLITFAAESGRRLRPKAYGMFLLVGLVGLVANTTVLVVAADTLSLPVWAAKLCAIATSFVVNFSLANFVVFRRPHASL